MAQSDPDTEDEQRRGKEETGSDVLPEPLNVAMAMLWIVLFGGRWLIVPQLEAAGVLTPDQVAGMDDGPLQKIYLILLSITCLVLALRAVRTTQPSKPSTK